MSVQDLFSHPYFGPSIALITASFAAVLSAAKERGRKGWLIAAAFIAFALLGALSSVSSGKRTLNEQSAELTKQKLAHQKELDDQQEQMNLLRSGIEQVVSCFSISPDSKTCALSVRLLAKQAAAMPIAKTIGGPGMASSSAQNEEMARKAHDLAVKLRGSFEDAKAKIKLRENQRTDNLTKDLVSHGMDPNVAREDASPRPDSSQVREQRFTAEASDEAYNANREMLDQLLVFCESHPAYGSEPLTQAKSNIRSLCQSSILPGTPGCADSLDRLAKLLESSSSR